MRNRDKLALVCLVSAVVLFSATDLCAAGGNLPWEGPLIRIWRSCTGPIALVGGTLAIIGTGLGLAFSEGGGFMRKGLTLVFGLSIVFTANTLLADVFGYAGGAGF